MIGREVEDLVPWHSCLENIALWEEELRKGQFNNFFSVDSRNFGCLQVKWAGRRIYPGRSRDPHHG